MNNSRLSRVGALAVAILSLGVGIAGRASQPSERERFDKLFADGNFKDALEGYRRLALDPKTEPDRVGTDLQTGSRLSGAPGPPR